MTENIVLLIVSLVLICLFMRFIYFYAKLRAMNQHRDAFERFLVATQEKPSDYQPYAELAESWMEITKLVRQAGIDVVLLSRAPSIGMARTTSISILKDLSIAEKLPILESIQQSIGYFRARRNETFSPVFWIESLIGWPRSLLGFFGFDSNGTFAKFLQIVVLILEIVGGIILVATNYSTNL